MKKGPQHKFVVGFLALLYLTFGVSIPRWGWVGPAVGFILDERFNCIAKFGYCYDVVCHPSFCVTQVILLICDKTIEFRMTCFSLKSSELCQLSQNKFDGEIRMGFTRITGSIWGGVVVFDFLALYIQMERNRAYGHNYCIVSFVPPISTMDVYRGITKY